MITHVFHIHQHDWLVKAYINSDVSDADLILGDLLSVGADMDTMRLAFRNLRRGVKNTGLTYTSPWYRTTIMVVSESTSAEEFFNSLVHEISHAKTHICEYLGIDLTSEEASYFSGGLARDLFPHVKHLLCESCRDKITECHCEH
jgi:hypothetical protein